MKIPRLAKIGLFFLILGVGGIAYIIMSSDGFSGFNTDTFEVTIDDATGLSTRSKIFMAGVAVGKVEKITLVGTHALLSIALEKGLEIGADAKLARKSSSILGTSILTIEPGHPMSSRAMPGDRLEADNSPDGINAVIDMAGDLSTQVGGVLKEFQQTHLALLAVTIETVNSIAKKIDAQMDDELDRVSRILESVAAITAQTEKLMGRHDADLDGTLSGLYGTIDNLRAITGEIRSGEGNIGKTIYDDKLYTSILAAANEATAALTNINKLVTDADGVVTGVAEIVDQAAGISVELDSFARYDFRYGEGRGGASLRLIPRSNDRWYSIGVSSAPNGVTTLTTERITDSSNGNRVVETEKTTNALLIDAQVARTFGPLTLRGGILENTAGVGFDFQPIKWGSLSAEFFDFANEENPNLKSFVTFYPFFNPNSNKPWNWIYLRSGVNNILDPKRDFFVSGGLRFTDKEVKGLVGLIPVLSGL
ncbi:hypothetical protein FACS1894200_05370 [Spirochaetia bacterium]|nr:hypothetical protein FACS1894200_05370 [Spirochaetia bacterium]